MEGSRPDGQHPSSCSPCLRLLLYAATCHLGTDTRGPRAPPRRLGLFAFVARCKASHATPPVFATQNLLLFMTFLVLSYLTRGNQVAQSIRATCRDAQTSMEALHANAAHQQGMLSAAVSILDLAAGGGAFDQRGALQVTEDHVQVS